MPLKILIVDDSKYMRNLLSKKLEAEPDFRIIDTATNGQEAVEKVRLHKPDCITMDVNMPVMNGIEAVKNIMNEIPTPVIMLSAYTDKDAGLTLEALRAGAIDFVRKPDGEISINIDSIMDELISKIRNSVKVKLSKIDIQYNRKKTLNKNLTDLSAKRNAYRVIVIGISTGGPALLSEILPMLASDFRAAVIITQHMPEKYTGLLAEQLSEICSMDIIEAENGQQIKESCVYICPGSYNLQIKKGIIHLTEIDRNSLWKPSIDVMFKSAAEEYGNNAVGIILTGMGNDGLEGCMEIKKYSGTVICQEPDTAAARRMPVSVIEKGYADMILKPRVLAAALNYWQKNNYKFCGMENIL
jgi:two-component system chemotaxis response regulator CheB